MSLDHREVVAEHFERGIEYGQEHQMSKADLRNVLEDLLNEGLPEVPCLVGSYDDAIRIAMLDIEGQAQVTASGPIEKHMNFGIKQGDQTTMMCDWPGLEGTHYCVKYAITQIGDSFEVTAVSHIHMSEGRVQVIIRS